MAASMEKLPLILLLLLLLFVSSVFNNAATAELACEDLPIELCAFSISSSGKRCLIETVAMEDGGVEYQCRSSEVIVERLAEYIETEECVNACGIDRKSVGISSDSLLEAQFTNKLCSNACYERCTNIVDLYFNLAAGEGVFLPDLCEAQRLNPHRAMVELMSNGAAPGPASSASLIFEASASAPAPSPL